MTRAMIRARAPVAYGPPYKPDAGISPDYGPDVQRALRRHPSSWAFGVLLNKLARNAADEPSRE
jgi:hypothetical protein